VLTFDGGGGAALKLGGILGNENKKLLVELKSKGFEEFEEFEESVGVEEEEDGEEEVLAMDGVVLVVDIPLEELDTVVVLEVPAADRDDKEAVGVVLVEVVVVVVVVVVVELEVIVAEVDESVVDAVIPLVPEG